MKKISWSTVAVVALVMVLVSLTGASFTQIGEWFQSLSKPSFQPPNWLFAPVWTILYLFIGISAYLIYTSKKEGSRIVLTILAANLVLNVLWSFFFFTQHNLLLALIDLILLWITIVVIIAKARQISRLSVWLFVPYLLWVSFAGVLNYAILILNR